MRFISTARRLRQILFALLAVQLTAASMVAAADPVSLKTVPVPEPENLARFVADRGAAIRLGKALFWDVQVGSDGLTACATCHFHAGSDHRTKNTLSAGPDGLFDVLGRANMTTMGGDFPFHQTVDRHNRGSGGLLADDPAVLRSSDDVISSQGVVLTRFSGVLEAQPRDAGRDLRDLHFSRNARNVRQVMERNAPTVINAVFNLANFWDGRANAHFNGRNPFGVQDPDARIWINNGGSLQAISLVDPDVPEYQLNNASLASQSVSPAISSVEMSWKGRSFPDLGRKLLTLSPLGLQAVHVNDSVLGLLSRGRIDPAFKGLATTYADMIQAAFLPEFWSGTDRVDGYSQMELNFSLFWGLALQLYQSTLVSDDSPFDRFMEGDPLALSESAQRGFGLFLAGGTGCVNCHVGSEFTSASISNATDPAEPGVIETMNMGDGLLGTYDIGFYNIGVTRTADDPGRGGSDPFGNPLSFAHQRAIVNGSQSGSLTFDPRFVPDQGCVPDLRADPPLICPPTGTDIGRVAAQGAFKTPTLRNVELTGPYMHNGSMLTLMQVVDFYVRGGNFREANLADLDPFMQDIEGLKGDDKEEDRVALVDFLKSLTDERVRWERAPFDHPELILADGHQEVPVGNLKHDRALPSDLRVLPAVGASGRQPEGLPPLKPYLADELTGAALESFHYQP